MFKYLVILGALAQLTGVFFYVRGIISGKVKPNKATWSMWFIAPFIGFIAGLSKGASLADLPVFMSCFGPLIIFSFSLINPNSYWKLVKFDYLCILFSALALILWAISKNANIAIIFAIISDLIAAVPTLTKSWSYPKTENIAPYFAGLINSLTAFGAMRVWDFSELAFPTYLIFLNIAFILFIYRNLIILKVNKKGKPVPPPSYS